MKLKLEKAKAITSNLDLKKKAEKAHKSLHRKSVVHTRRHVSGRIDSIKNINTKRLVFSWATKFVIIIVLAFLSFSKLNSAGRYEGFVAGGNIVVGIQDESTKLNLNPLTLSSPGEFALGNLIYSSLLKYDQTENIKGDLAESFKVSADGKKISLKLKANAKWHDGKDVTATDVAFTVARLKDSRTGSSFRDSLSGIEVAVVDAKNLEVNSPKAVVGLDDLFTRVKIAPAHLFKDVAEDKITSVDYNSLPVGSGALEVSSDLSLRENSLVGIENDRSFQQIRLTPNKNYYENSAQADLIFRVFRTKEDLTLAFKNNAIELYVDGGESSALVGEASEVKLKLASGVFAFYNLESPTLKEVKLRRALGGYLDRTTVAELSSGVSPLYSPILGVGDTEEPRMGKEDARKLITESGWQFDETQKLFVRDGLPLEINLVTGESESYKKTSQAIKQSWSELGVKVEVVEAKTSELQSNYFVNRSYDVLVYGIALNQASDPYAYWSSSAAAGRGLNFSSYKSPASDADLDVARTKLNDVERVARLDRFVKRWKEDVPATPLYVPSVKVVYLAKSVQPEPSTSQHYSGFADALDFLKNIKGSQKKLYSNPDN